MIPWIQVNCNVLTHDKTYALAEALKIPNYSAVGIMVSLWAWAGINAPDGDITKYPPRAIAEATGYTKKPNDFYNTLLKIKLIEKIPIKNCNESVNSEKFSENFSEKVVIRNWDQYASLLMDLVDEQRKKTNERVKRHRAKKSAKAQKTDASEDSEDGKESECNVTETLHDDSGNVTETPCNALPNLTIPNHTKPINNICGGDESAREKNQTASGNLVDYLPELNVYFGITDSIKLECKRFTESLFDKNCTRRACKQDVVYVFMLIYESYQDQHGDWKMILNADKKSVLEYAFSAAAGAGNTSWNYINGVLENIRRRSLKNADECEDYDVKRDIEKNGF